MKAYLVMCHYENGESWEDGEVRDSVAAVASTEEKAKVFIANINPDDYELTQYQDKWDEENPYPNRIKAERVFSEHTRGKMYAVLSFSIHERKMI